MYRSNQSIIRATIIIGMMVLAALTRLLPHPANFTAVLAVALFSGAKLKNKSLAVLLPMIVLMLTDLIKGFYSLMPYVYVCVVITSLIGIYVGRKSNPIMIIGGSLLGSLIFFLVTNAAVWSINPQLYPQTWSGLATCYDFAAPFFRNQLFGDLFFNFLLFGSYQVAKGRIPSLA
jgi:hypothetical protein